MERARLATFTPQRANINKHTQRGTKLLEDSIQRDGFISAMTAARDGEIFDGSNRLLVAADKDFEDAIVVESDGTRPVIVKRTDIPNADDPRAKRLGFLANQITLTDFDPDAELLAKLAAADTIVNLIAREEQALAALRAHVDDDDEKRAIKTMSHGYFSDGEHSENYRKICYRIEATGKAKNGLALEMYAGQGQLSYWYRRHFARVVTVDRAAHAGIELVMSCENFIEDKLKDYLGFDLVDFDDEGSPALAIRKFFDVIRKKPRRFVLCFTDGIIHTLHIRGPWTPANYLIGSSPKAAKATARDFANCTGIIQTFIERVAAPQFRIDWLALDRNSRLTAVYGTCLVSPA